MRILWIINIVMPELAEHLNIQTSPSGTWMIDISKQLSALQEITLGIACVYGHEYKELEVNGIRYFMLPGNAKNMLFYTKKYESLWEKVYHDFLPDIVHIHGTEYSHGLSFMRKYPHVKSVISIQGLLNRIKDVDFGGLTLAQALRYRTLKEYLHLNGMIETHLLYKKNARHEKEMLRRARYANCVNFWDSSVVKSLNPDIKCFLIDYNLRDEFYHSSKWNITDMERHTILTNPVGMPLKGLHMLLKALAIVKKEYPSVELRVPGGLSADNKIVPNTGYLRYVTDLIRELDLADNVKFIGRQSGTQMIGQMLKANVVVIPSAIEGTSLVLREAMFLGVPCIASFRGGMADFISDKTDGYLYDYQEYPYLAFRMIELLKNDQQCIEFSKNAIIKAEKTQDRRKNPRDYLEMYREIYATEN